MDRSMALSIDMDYDDDSLMGDATDDLTPISSMAVVAGTGVTTMEQSQRASTPLDEDSMTLEPEEQQHQQQQQQLQSPIKTNSTDTSQYTPDVKQRFAKNKKSLDNMLFNKFGNYHSFSEQQQAATESVENITGGVELEAPTDYIGDSEQEATAAIPACEDRTEAASNDAPIDADSSIDDTERLVIAENTSSDTAVTDLAPATAVTEKEVEDEATTGADTAEEEMNQDTNTTELQQITQQNNSFNDVSIESELVIKTDANANNKTNVLAVTDGKFSPDVNGNSKSTSSVITSELNSSIIINSDEPTTSTEQSTQSNNNTDESLKNPILCESELSGISSVTTDKLDKLPDIEAMLDYADKTDNQVQQLNTLLSNGLSSEEQEVEQQCVDKSVSSIDITQQQQQQHNDSETLAATDCTEITENSLLNDDNSELLKSNPNPNPSQSPRKGIPVKNPLQREPIKTRTTTRASSITTRRSSAMREELEAK